MQLGSLIKKARKDASFSIDDLSGATNIRVSLLREIEADDFTHCGGETYSRGHIRNIATKLGVDPQIFIHAFETEQIHATRSMQDLLVENSIMKQPGEPRKISWKVLATISVASLLVLGVAQIIFSNTSTTDMPSPIESPSTQSSPTPTASSQENSQDPPAVSTGIGVEVVVSATRAKSWLFVSDSAGRTLFSGIIPQGVSKIFTSDISLNLKVGNAGGVDLRVNGKVVDAIGANGQVVSVSYGVDS